MLYSADSESGSVNPAHGDWQRGIRIGSIKDGKVTAFIPDPQKDVKQGTLAAEGSLRLQRASFSRCRDGGSSRRPRRSLSTTGRTPMRWSRTS
jgi:hypothetical protein